MAKRSSYKLVPKYFRPSQVVERIGLVAYRLQLPDDAKIHDVFHVSLLKAYKGDIPATIPPLDNFDSIEERKQPIAICSVCSIEQDGVTIR